jgi:hypothetical protein
MGGTHGRKKMGMKKPKTKISMKPVRGKYAKASKGKAVRKGRY